MPWCGLNPLYRQFALEIRHAAPHSTVSHMSTYNVMCAPQLLLAAKADVTLRSDAGFLAWEMAEDAGFSALHKTVKAKSTASQLFLFCVGCFDLLMGETRCC